MAKLNLDFYKEDINYDNSLTEQEELDIINYIKEYDEADYEKIFEKDFRTQIFINLSNIRKNIISWYPFKKDCDILEIGPNFGNLTGYLCENSNTVTTLEFSKKRAEAISKRFSNKENLEIIVGKLDEITFSKKFDYIVLIGICEYADSLFGGIDQLIKYVKPFLKNKGVILLGIDNKFGIKYFAGAKNSDNDTPYSSMTGNYGNYHMYSKYEIEEIIKKNNFLNYKFYYPLPDYKLTNVIFSDNYLPNGNHSKVNYNIYYPQYDNILFSELNLVHELVKSNEFTKFSNSFLIEINGYENDNIFIGFNNMRKDEFKAITKLTLNEAIKIPYIEKSNNHILNIKDNILRLKKLGFEIYENYEENKIKSKFLNYPTLDVELVKSLKNNEIEKFYISVNNWYLYIKSKLSISNNNTNILNKFNINIPTEYLDEMYIVEDGYIDMVFQNTFVDNQNYIMFDQEWYEKNVPLEFILYRSINNLFFNNKFLGRIITKEQVFEYFNILKFIPIFIELEEKWQMSIADINIIRFYTNSYNRIKSLDEILNDTTIEIRKELNNKNEIIKDLEERKTKIENDNSILISEVSSLNKKIEGILNSRSWRYTKIFRKEEKNK